MILKEFTWKIFCLQIVIPLSIKKKIELGYREHHRDGIGYNIPLMIYPSVNKNVEMSG
jgi:hypothetical protein